MHVAAQLFLAQAGFLVLGADFKSADVHSGDAVQLKSQNTRWGWVREGQ
jgi:hypothetical protein